MGKSSKPKTEIIHYYMAEYFGISVAVDALLGITIKEKEAWTGEETAANSFTIDKDQLFGGPAKEGGVQAVVYWLPGDAAQVLPDVLAQKLGRADGADAPGFRGVASAWFVGPKGTPFADFWDDHFEGKAGAYWSANSPYLPGVWFKVRRAPVGLNPDYALVPISGGEAGDLTGEVELTWWQSSYPAVFVDEGRMGITFHDSSGFQIGSEFAAYMAPTPSTWEERSVTATCPDGTANIRIHMQGNRFGTGKCDAYFDDIEVTLDGLPLTVTNPDAEINNMTGWTISHGSWYCRSASPSAHGGSRYFAGGPSAQPTAYQDVLDISISTPADANPAHIIFECLTNTDWGMGSPEAAFDKAGFEAVAITLYGEGFGLSMIWTRQASIQDFIQEVLDHINAVLFVDPSTGLLTLKLIRGDYDADTLDEITPDNAVLSSFSRKLWGEIPNEITVSWTNPTNEQEETAPPAQDLASIATQGLIADSRNYYGVRNGPLAQRLAWRDLASSGQPLATFEAELDRTQYLLRPASLIKVTWPEYGLAGVVCRVTSVDYGRPGDMTIKVSLVEDVFGVDFGAYEDPPSSSWVDPSEPPEPLTLERLFTMPLFFAANSSVADFINTPEYPEVVAGVLGTTDQADAYAFDLWDEVTLGNGSLQWQSLTELNIIGHAELVGALAAEAASTGVSFDTFTGDNSPVVAGFVIIGDGEESENEIAMVDAVGGTYDLVRGVLDTVPRAWPAGTPVWFIDDSVPFEYPAVLSAGETLDVKLLTRTSQGVLPLADAALVSHELTERPWLPNRPANVAVDGVLFNTDVTPVDMTGRPDPWVPVSWANRNRLLEDTQVLGWTDATVTPETGQTTTIEVLTANLVTVLATHDSLSGTSFDVPDASFASEEIVGLRFSAERTDGDGTFVSLQAHVIWVQVVSGLITEEGDSLITEDGDLLDLED